MSPQDLLPRSWDVPQKFRDRLGRKIGRQRAMIHEDHLLLVLHAPPLPEQDERRGQFFWRKPSGEWTSSELGSGPGALAKHLDQYAERIDALDKREEQATSAKDYFDVLETLAPLHRAARNLYTVLQDARKQCPEVRELIDFRDRAYEIQRTADLLSSAAKNSLDFLMARRAEEQSRSSEKMAVAAHRLNVLAAFFFPLATLCAIFGMDFPGGLRGFPEQYLYLAIILLGLLLGALLTLFVRVGKHDAH